ncbi:M23 family metallopeptidase [Planctomonas sp. JC2975]|uniref:murein hydrolase activator EnvC family protein n=1 Tax=Planctomonas sp. JC2975 TaxID=2729626 RepID=UPI0014737A4D|nr:M23 family metallopeptidase [Planctomonas sp. JC2975]
MDARAVLLLVRFAVLLLLRFAEALPHPNFAIRAWSTDGGSGSNPGPESHQDRPMPSPRSHTATRAVAVLAAAAVALASVGNPEPADASGRNHATGRDAPGAHATPRSVAALPAGTWVWPFPGPHAVARGFEAPVSRYAAGHRGIDLPTNPGQLVRAPEGGTVRFAGVVVDRPTLTIATSSGVLISLEPVTTSLVAGDLVARGATVGVVATGGHCSQSCVHLGVRVAGQYVSPLRFFGGVPRAVLLPIRDRG